MIAVWIILGVVVLLLIAGIEEPLERLEAFGRLVEEVRERRLAETTLPARPDVTA